MSTSRSTDFGTYVLVEEGEPTVTNPTVWYSQRFDYAAGTPAANAQTISQAAANALVANRTYLAIGSPTTAQAVTQVRALTQQVQALIHLAIGDLSGTT